MTTRLTNTLREEILESVMRATDFPAQRAAIEQQTSEVAMQLCISAQPPGWDALVKDHPADWFKLDASVWADRSVNPLVALENGNWHRRIDYPKPVPVAVELSLTTVQVELWFGDLFKRATAWREAYDATRGELRAFLMSCRTAEQLVERMPELEKYVPKAAKPYPLVASNSVLSRLAAFGFDRTVAAT